MMVKKSLELYLRYSQPLWECMFQCWQVIATRWQCKAKNCFAVLTFWYTSGPLEEVVWMLALPNTHRLVQWLSWHTGAPWLSQLPLTNLPGRALAWRDVGRPIDVTQIIVFCLVHNRRKSQWAEDRSESILSQKQLFFYSYVFCLCLCIHLIK